MKIMAVDFGDARTGLAMCDKTEFLASPIGVIHEKRFEHAVEKVAAAAIEHKAEACELIRRNREKFCAWNLRVVEGHAPEALHELPAPDVVFLGGTGRKMSEILQVVRAKNPKARVCISAIALETLSAAIAALAAHGQTAEVTQLAVSRTRPAGKLHLLMANNPIFLITGERK